MYTLEYSRVLPPGTRGQGIESIFFLGGSSLCAKPCPPASLSRSLPVIAGLMRGLSNTAEDQTRYGSRESLELLY